jgi:hypothetical protein
MQSTIITCVLSLGVLAAAQDVQFDYDRSANFHAYRTYQWADSNASAANQLMDQNIKRAVDTQLAAKGMQRVESGADLHIAYRVARNQEKQFDGFGTGPRWAGMGRVTTSTIDVGKLEVDMFDPAKKQLVWRGAAEKTLDIKKDPDKNYRNLEKATAKLLKNYPPVAGH